MQFENTKEAGIKNVLKEIAESGFIIVKARLTEESAKHLGCNF
jgi:hypothetical protein